MNNHAHKTQKRIRRHAAIRSRISGTDTVPRLAVFRSNKFIYAQLINDVTGTTMLSASDIKLSNGTKSERAALVGAEIAKLALAKKVTRVVFDRGGFKYIGRVQTLADAARKGGLAF